MPRTNASNFKQGKAGEEYVQSHINQLLDHGLVTYNDDTAEDYVEGGDNRIIYSSFGDEATAEEFLLDGVVDIDGAGHAITQHLIGGLEVKTISGFLFRDNDMDEPSGTLPFELWNDKRRTKYGWLLALLYPELRLRQEEEQPFHAVQPVLFCFLLVSYHGPFACIMFEDFPALAQRLKELAEERGFKLDPEHIPVGDNATGWQQDDPYIIDNMWHIPFDRVYDLATVTMIGDMPRKRCSIQLDQPTTAYESLQQGRYDFLCQCAHDRRLSSEIQSKTDFYPADDNHIYADILQNMEIIENLKEEEYPFLYQALKCRNMRAHLNCTLLNMYSHQMPTKVGRMIGFLQAKEYLEQWGKMNGIPGSTFSWQAHLIFLTDAGLIKKYVDGQRPINIQVFRSVPRYTPRILAAAEKKAKKYIEAGINLNKFTKSDVIRVSGQKRADFLFYGDGRVISAIEDEVLDAFVMVVKDKLDEKSYVLPSEVVEIVEHNILEKYWVDPIDEEVTPEQEHDYVTACRQINHLEERFKQLAKEGSCQWRELTKEEKKSLQLPPRFRKKVFIR